MARGRKTEAENGDFRNELFKTLEMFKITKLVVHYSGSGDSGQTDDVTTEPSGRSELLDETMESGKSIRDAVDEFAWEEIENHEGGFYNNEGGYGEIIFDVKDKTITMAHNNYIQETQYEEYDLT